MSTEPNIRADIADLTDPLIVAPTPTPFDANDRVDADALARNVERWNRTPLSGFVLGTANGEELSLSDDEKTLIVRVVAEARTPDRMVIAGIDTPSATYTLDLAARYADAGADMVRVRIPRQGGHEAVLRYFGEVCSRSPLPVVVIHQTFTGIPAASPEVISEICSHHNVFGYITDHDIRFEGRVALTFPHDKRFWICNGGLLLAGAVMGANGACMWLGNIAPALCRGIMASGLNGSFMDARPLQRAATMLDLVINRYGVAGVKRALGLMGFEGMTPRSPLAPVSEEDATGIADALKQAKLLG
jgi:4-hydroxy-tetrahydrodipicolinate synthase